ncbi:MAG: ATP-binding cassette domain-containing protein [Cytophagales bacterium]|nr:ATP-binding cassette domain-containing protein [Cytophagales bacterium]
MSVQVENLLKCYQEQRAVNDVSFSIETGEVVGFLGPNGAGKSTTMKIITCYMSPTSGDVRIGQHSILDAAAEIKKKVGYLPESNPLYTDMAVMDFLYFSAEIQGVGSSRIPGRIREMVDVCGLGSEKHKKIGELSKGYKQRVGLAQAMIHDPEVLILDEPTSGLDPNQIVEIRKLIKELGKEKTVILSSHILSEVELTCDRIIIINRGRIVADGKGEELRKGLDKREVVEIRIEFEGGTEEVKKALLGIASVEQVDEEDGGAFQVRSKPGLSSRKELFELCVKKGWNLLGLSKQETRLEDVFKELTQ